MQHKWNISKIHARMQTVMIHLLKDQFNLNYKSKCSDMYRQLQLNAVSNAYKYILMQPRKEKFINYFNIISDFEISHKPGLFRNSTYIGVLTVFSYLSFSLAMSKNLSNGHRNHISSPKYPLFSSLSALFFSVPKSFLLQYTGNYL